MMRFLTSLRAALSLIIFFTLMLGGVYTLAITGLAQTIFSAKSHGSLITRGDVTYGSRLIGQQFTENKYFWGRISALAEPYNPANSGGSNLSVNNPKLLEQAQTRIAALKKADPKNKTLIPLDLVTASASGLDPHISPEAARYQLPRVAHARNMSQSDLSELISKNTHSGLFGLLSDDYVNIVTLNLALDDMAHGEGKKEKR